jgi:hypothetical protein
MMSLLFMQLSHFLSLESSLIKLTLRSSSPQAERPPLVGEVTANLCGFLDPEPLLFHSSSSSVILTRLSGPCSRPTTSQEIR